MRDAASAMRTTLDLDEDILLAAKALAQAHERTMGMVVSELCRKSLRPAKPSRTRNGVPLFAGKAVGTGPVTLALVHRLRADAP